MVNFFIRLGLLIGYLVVLPLLAVVFALVLTLGVPFTILFGEVTISGKRIV